MAQADKITALYCRFSYDDTNKYESDSVANQKAILKEYADAHGLPNQRFYVDDGVSGTNFERDGFKAMLRDIENGLVGTVIVKDMSRFGRNYLMVGQYLEIIFPENNIRFIAISDNVDSNDGLSDVMPFHNIMNEWYARDISRKIRAVVQSKGNNGERTTTLAVYGYKKDPNNSKKWIIDEPAAKIVRRVFDMYINGIGISEIARTLTAEKILRPTAYLGYSVGVRCDDFDEYYWHNSMIRKILGRQEYCGDTINFRTTRLSYKSDKVIFNPKEKQRIFYNTQDPIISREVFEEAQKRLPLRRNIPRTSVRSPYYGFLFCSDCKRMMTVRNRKTSENVPYRTYYCSLAAKKLGLCSMHGIDEIVLDMLIIKEINRLLDFAKSDKKAFSKFIIERCSGNALAELNANTTEMESIKDRIAEIDRFTQGLFESKVKGEIDSEMFCTLSEKYRSEKTELKSRLEVLIEKNKHLKTDADRSVKLGTSVNKYDTISEVTSEILKDFIEKIEVGDFTGEKFKKKKVRKIRIFFVGIGEFDIE